MKTSITHLPEIKRKEIQEILQIIIEEGKPEKVILFGSHANGNWVEDEYKEDGINFTYISDYDFLVVISENERKEQSITTSIENRCTHFKNAVSVIVHRVNYINEGLSIGQYFFTDIINEGILLYDVGKTTLVQAKELTLDQEKSKAQNYFDIWFPKGTSFLRGADFYFKDQDFSSGVFLLHQSAECFYSAALLFFYGYKPKTHNLQKLRNYSKHISQELYTIFRTPIIDENEYYLFELLKRGYIDSRYKLDFSITAEEFTALFDKIVRMQSVVKKIYEEKIQTFN